MCTRHPLNVYTNIEKYSPDCKGVYTLHGATGSHPPHAKDADPVWSPRLSIIPTYRLLHSVWLDVASAAPLMLAVPFSTDTV